MIHVQRCFTQRDDDGRVWLCWYEPARDPRESRSILNRTVIGVPVARPLSEAERIAANGIDSTR